MISLEGKVGVMSVSTDIITESVSTPTAYHCLRVRMVVARTLALLAGGFALRLVVVEVEAIFPAASPRPAVP